MQNKNYRVHAINIKYFDEFLIVLNENVDKV